METRESKKEKRREKRRKIKRKHHHTRSKKREMTSRQEEERSSEDDTPTEPSPLTEITREGEDKVDRTTDQTAKLAEQEAMEKTRTSQRISALLRKREDLDKMVAEKIISAEEAEKIFEEEVAATKSKTPQEEAALLTLASTSTGTKKPIVTTRDPYSEVGVVEVGQQPVQEDVVEAAYRYFKKCCIIMLSLYIIFFFS